MYALLTLKFKLVKLRETNSRKKCEASKWRWNLSLPTPAHRNMPIISGTHKSAYLCILCFKGYSQMGSSQRCGWRRCKLYCTWTLQCWISTVHAKKTLFTAQHLKKDAAGVSYCQPENNPQKFSAWAWSAAETPALSIPLFILMLCFGCQGIQNHATVRIDFRLMGRLLSFSSRSP